MSETKIADAYNPDVKILKVKIMKHTASKREYYFDKAFTIGRSDECSIQINEGIVSRIHAEVCRENGRWYIIDKQSSNGTFFNGNKIDKLEIKNSLSIELGRNGPILLFTFETNKNSANNTDSIKPDNKTVSSYIQHYFDESKGDHEIGEHTRMMREAFKIVKKKQTSKYKRAIIIFGIIAILAAAYSIYQHTKESQQKLLAENIFYNMKSLELEISAFKNRLSDSGDEAAKEAIQKFDERHDQLENNYDKLVDELGVYDMSDEDKLIIQMARIFGECELNVPKDFIAEVKNYIKKWQSSNRLYDAIRRARLGGYTQTIVDYFVRQHLAPQFYYLALQESDFNDHVVGPSTRYGIAKGMWQFIPQTAVKYGLSVGPLTSVRVYDPRDDRYNFLKATSAAAKYISDIYNTDAQASGLLVIASYNWGEYNIIDLIRKMPANPRDRNFWNLLERYKDKIPAETYNYVFYIFSAAVIGENPHLFGFNFDNPLKSALQNLNN